MKLSPRPPCHFVEAERMFFPFFFSSFAIRSSSPPVWIIWELSCHVMSNLFLLPSQWQSFLVDYLRAEYGVSTPYHWLNFQ